MRSNLVIIGVVLLFSFCKKDKKTDDPVAPTTPDIGTVKVSYKATVDAENFSFGTQYKNANGDTFVVNMFKYYIGDVKLVKDDGTKFSEGKYHLINHATTSSFDMSGIPAGTYKSMIMTLGVDSARNVSGAQDGDLAPSKGMFWDWNTGYIMLKLEGNSPQADNFNKDIAFHLGGYSAPNSAIRTITISFATDLVISKDKNPELKLKTNINEMFKNPNTVDFYTYHTVTSPGLSSNFICNNYSDMFSFDAIVP